MTAIVAMGLVAIVAWCAAKRVDTRCLTDDPRIGRLGEPKQKQLPAGVSYVYSFNGKLMRRWQDDNGVVHLELADLRQQHGLKDRDADQS